jgi:hypothetical protein
VGGAHALLLSFAMSSVWTSYSHTQTIVVQEANAVADLDRMRPAFPVPVQREVQEVWPPRTFGWSSTRNGS